MPRGRLEALKLAGPFHDIGKLRVPGLADAWDAVTTERPYSRARSAAAAARSSTRAVVDAFFAAFHVRGDGEQALVART